MQGHSLTLEMHILVRGNYERSGYIVYKDSDLGIQSGWTFHHADLSESLGHIKNCRVYSVECVFKIKLIVSIIFYATHGAVCIQLTHFSFHESLEYLYYLHSIVIIKSEIWIINYCLKLGHEIVVCAVCLVMFFLSWQHFSICSIEKIHKRRLSQ